MIRYAILNEKKEVVPVDSVLEWAHWFGDQRKRRVAESHVGPARISTIFLGLDYAWLTDERPLWFETMIFGGPLDMGTWRCTTWDEALAQHGVAEALARARTKP